MEPISARDIIPGAMPDNDGRCVTCHATIPDGAPCCPYCDPYAFDRWAYSEDEA